jgi:hypothetical protein
MKEQNSGENSCFGGVGEGSSNIFIHITVISVNINNISEERIWGQVD